jgi:hypothetical protein
MGWLTLTREAPGSDGIATYPSSAITPSSTDDEVEANLGFQGSTRSVQ